MGPHTKRDINLHEGVQKFALRVCFEQYSGSYEDLLSIANIIPVLKARRTFFKLCVLSVIFIWVFYFFVFSDS